jgi:hypothetical protein
MQASQWYTGHARHGCPLACKCICKLHMLHSAQLACAMPQTTQTGPQAQPCLPGSCLLPPRAHHTPHSIWATHIPESAAAPSGQVTHVTNHAHRGRRCTVHVAHGSMWLMRQVLYKHW